MTVSPLPEPKKSGFLSTIRGAVDSLLNVPRIIKTRFGQETQVPAQPNINPTPTSHPLQPYLDKGWKLSVDSAPISQQSVQRPVQQQIVPSTYGRRTDFDWQGSASNNPQSVQAIMQAAQAYGIPPSLLFDVAASESSLDPRKTEKKYGTHSGLFQFDPGTWDTLRNYANMKNTTLTNFNPDYESRFDPFMNALAAAYLISHGQLGRWDDSLPAWEKYYTPEELKPYYSQTPSRR